MIHQGLVENQQNYQQQRAEEAFKKIEPTVERLRSQGEWVVVRFFYDAPKATNLTDFVFKEASDINKFLWITYHTGDTREEALGEEPARMDVAPLDMDKYEAPKNPLGEDRKGYVGDVRIFPPYPPNPQPIMIGHPGFVGTYSPDHVDQAPVGGSFVAMVTRGMHRSLRFHAGSAAVPLSVVEMWHVNGTRHLYETEWVSGNDLSKGISARFVEKSNGKTFYTITSDFLYLVTGFGVNLLLENVRGESAPEFNNFENWSAMIIWKQNDNSG